MTSFALVAAIAIAPTLAAAQPAPAPGAGAGTASGAPGEDDVLYSCKKAKGQVTVSFKPDTELKDLITWVMGFTCKNFIYDSSILTRSKKITIISPVKIISLARTRPTRRVRRWVPPKPGMTPRPTSGRPNFAFSEA